MKNPSQLTDPAINYHSAAEYRVAPENDVLEGRFLHRLFLFMHIPAAWPVWKIGLGLLAVAQRRLGVWQRGVLASGPREGTEFGEAPAPQ